MNPLLEQYLQEARENLKFIEQNLEDLGSGDDELINSIFRAIHTMKGGSGIVGFESIKDITHKAEDLLDLLRAGKLEFQPTMLDVLYDAFDEVFNLVEAAEQTGDVVEGDLETRERIIQELVEQSGGEDGASRWEMPFNMMEDCDETINNESFNLHNLHNTVPFEYSEIVEQNIDDERLYAILFDVPENCMVFGNDPIYAISLLDDKVLHIDSCFTKDTANDIINDNSDGLILKTQITIYVYAQYIDIEDAVYNFVDDLYFLPLDIKTLLSVSDGEFENIDFIKDFVKNAKDFIASGKIDDLKSSIVETLGLINKNSAQAKMLNRVLSILHIIDDVDLPKLNDYFECMASGKYYNSDKAPSTSATTVDVAATPASAPTTESTADSSQSEPVDTNLDAEEIEVLNDILEQQKKQLEVVKSDDVLQRVEGILKKCAKFLQTDLASGLSRDELSSWIDKALSGDIAPASQPEPTPAPVVESKPVATPAPVVESKPEPTPAPVVESKPTATPAPAPKAEPKPAQEAKPAPKAVVKAEKKEEKKPVKPQKQDVVGKVIKIDQGAIDQLMSIAGELLVAKNSLPYLADSVLDMDKETIKRSILEKYSFINRLSTQLQDLIIGMRMLPISYVFDRYPKLVREISRKLGKKVKLVQEGNETKLDKSIIEMLADPLIHIVRNSLDHGIESPERRIENGKDESGTLTMHAYPESDKVIIKIIDDGGGIAVDRVVNKVLEKGLLTIEKIEQMSDKEKAELVMLPGLSTAETISEFSGRGVGMDVVKKSIESFGGSISIDTVMEKGTTIKLSIPVSLAVTTLLSVSMNGLNYGFPMDIVNETVKIKKDEITYLNNEPFIYIRGQVVPLLFIDNMLDKGEVDSDKPLSIVVINVKGNSLAVVVNDLLGQLDVVQKPLEGMLENHPLFSGAALLGNGKIIMILDPLGLLELQAGNKK
jgi:two-component system chemotaxis sensor kinase CheA